MSDPTPAAQPALKARLAQLVLVALCALAGWIGTRLGAPPEVVREVQGVIRSEGGAVVSAALGLDAPKAPEAPEAPLPLAGQ